MSSTGGRQTEVGGLAIDAAGVVVMLNGNIRENRRARQSCEAPGNTDCVETKKLMLNVDTVRPPTRIYRLLEDGYEGSMFGGPEGRGPAATVRSQARLTGRGPAYHVRLHKTQMMKVEAQVQCADLTWVLRISEGWERLGSQ